MGEVTHSNPDEDSVEWQPSSQASAKIRGNPYLSIKIEKRLGQPLVIA